MHPAGQVGTFPAPLTRPVVVSPDASGYTRFMDRLPSHTTDRQDLIAAGVAAICLVLAAGMALAPEPVLSPGLRTVGSVVFAALGLGAIYWLLRSVLAPAEAINHVAKRHHSGDEKEVGQIYRIRRPHE